MKRFDPALRELSAKLTGRDAAIRTVHVEVLDPDAWPFTAHSDLIVGDDVDPALIADSSSKRAAQVANAVADTYILDQLEAKYRTTRRAATWLQDRLQELRGQASTAERAVLDHAYYDGLRFQIAARSADGTEIPVIDGGAFDWVGKLTNNRKAVYVASGIGSQIVPLMFRRGDREG